MCWVAFKSVVNAMRTIAEGKWKWFCINKLWAEAEVFWTQARTHLEAEGIERTEGSMGDGGGIGGWGLRVSTLLFRESITQWMWMRMQCKRIASTTRLSTYTHVKSRVRSLTRVCQLRSRFILNNKPTLGAYSIRSLHILLYYKLFYYKC